MNTVDIIGTEAICKTIENGKYSKFLIFRQGAMKGSTPVYRCDESKTISAATRGFKDWADSILRMNPNNNMAYDILLFNAKAGEEIEIDTDGGEEQAPRNGEKKKRDSIRFSFALNQYNNMSGHGYGGGLNIKDEIARGIEDYKKEDRITKLEAELKFIRENGIQGDDEEEESSEDAILKVTNFLKEIRMNNPGKRKVAHAAGEEDDEEEEDEGIIQTETADGGKKKRIERLNSALKTLKQFDPEWKDLYKLACIAKKQPLLFKGYMSKLRSIEL